MAKPTPIKLSIGNRNIRVNATGAEASLGRELGAAFDTIAKDLGWYCNQLEHFLPEDLKDALEPTFELSKVYCPKLTHRLVNSAYLESEYFRGTIRVEMGYGLHGDPDYAVMVHELPNYHVPPTKDKYLQDAIDETYYALIARIMENIKIRSGLGG